MTRNNKSWFEKQRAKGICFICKRKMDPNDRRQVHAQCRKLRDSGKTYKEVQEIVKNG